MDDYERRQVLKSKLTIGGTCLIVGAVVGWIGIANGLGWMSPQTAAQQTADAVQAKVDTLLAPYCADRFMANKADMLKLAKTDTYSQSEFIQSAIPKLAGESVDYTLSGNCLNIIEGRLKKASADTAKKT